jgi:hypothetical protein
LDTFQLKLDHTLTRSSTRLPNVPIKNVVISGENPGKVNVDDLPDHKYKVIFERRCHKNRNMDEIMQVITMYNATVTSMSLINLKLRFDYLSQLLTGMKNLRDLKLDNFQSVNSSSCKQSVIMPNLESLSIGCVLLAPGNNDRPGSYNIAEETLKLFKGNASISKFQLTIENEYSYIFKVRKGEFRKFIETLPHIKHLALKGYQIDELLSEKLPFKLETLDTESLDTHNNFLQDHKSSLKELRLQSLPTAPGSSEIVKAIYTKLKLEKFYLGDVALILNYEKQHAPKELFFSHEYLSYVEPVLALMKYGLCE